MVDDRNCYLPNLPKGRLSRVEDGRQRNWMPMLMSECRRRGKIKRLPGVRQLIFVCPDDGVNSQKIRGSGPIGKPQTPSLQRRIIPRYSER